jgi:ring-1,2-phenylacetyl-CoA epoxidase subunit PaaB
MRLELPENPTEPTPKPELDQLITYEVFHQKKENAAYTYVGPVHAANEEVAFLFGKEQYSRRYACTGMWVTETKNVMVTPYTDEAVSVYDVIRIQPETATGNEGKTAEAYEIFHLKKRGKAHQYMGTVSASSYEGALAQAKAQFSEKKPIVNVWVIKAADMFRSEEEDKDIWSTTKEKEYREATAYRVLDKITKYKEENPVA